MIDHRRSAYPGQPSRFQVGHEQDVHEDQQGEKKEHQEGVEGPRTVVVVRPVEPCLLKREREKMFWTHKNKSQEGKRV